MFRAGAEPGMPLDGDPIRHANLALLTQTAIAHRAPLAAASSFPSTPARLPVSASGFLWRFSGVLKHKKNALLSIPIVQLHKTSTSIIIFPKSNAFALGSHILSRPKHTSKTGNPLWLHLSRPESLTTPCFARFVLFRRPNPDRPSRVVVVSCQDTHSPMATCRVWFRRSPVSTRGRQHVSLSVSWRPSRVFLPRSSTNILVFLLLFLLLSLLSMPFCDGCSALVRN